SLPPYTRFLVSHLQGRWDDALERARRMVAHHQVVHPTVNHHLLTARMAGILLAQGRTTGATRLIDAARGRQDGPLEASLDHAEAEVLRTLGNPAGAEQALRRGLASADARGHVHGTEELWAALADLLADEGRLDEAAACLRRVERIVDRTGNGRARLLHLLGSARLTRDRPDEARRRLLEAVELARSRAQPFETAVTLLTAAAAGAGPADTLLEAYELFGEIGSALWRSRTRAAMREVGRTVPGRKQATAENERLLAVLLAEGLSNRHIATVLGLSEDAVANRLTRLFARTGLRSRAKVVKAVLTGRPLTDACA
ncbi:tetratricopeptide repeat protein, partial [Streptomyces sp. NPDC005573]|uniref:tetratricopeptide repeat protein n=1 Tax=Streptomyces sp. NPDC005573 TaxID=3156890 RepID=UPI0033BBF05B